MLLVLAALSSAGAGAHRVNVFAWSEGEAVEVEAKFNKSGPAKGAKLTVTDLDNGRDLAAGTTSDAGKWTFRLPADYRTRQGIRITVNAGEGHVAHWDMAAEDLPSSARGKPAVAAADAAPAAASHVAASSPAEAPAALPGISREELESAVASAVSAQIAPLKRDIAELRNPDPSLRDIVGGLGWIIGLAGAAALGFSRRPQAQHKSKDTGTP